MADDISLNINGVNDLKRALLGIPDRLRKRVLLEALRGSTVPLRAKAKSAAPVLKRATKYRKKGTVKRALAIRTSKIAAQAGNVGVFVGVRPLKGARQRTLGAAGAKNPNDPFYWKFLEFGTKKMTARPFLEPTASLLPQVARDFSARAIAAINKLNNR